MDLELAIAKDKMVATLYAYRHGAKIAVARFKSKGQPFSCSMIDTCMGYIRDEAPDYVGRVKVIQEGEDNGTG